MSIIQHELDEMKKIWDTHYIREVRKSESPPGWPNILYFLPERSGGRNCSFPINMNVVQMLCWTDIYNRLYRSFPWTCKIDYAWKCVRATKKCYWSKKSFCNPYSKYWGNAWLKHNYSQLQLSRNCKGPERMFKIKRSLW